MSNMENSKETDFGDTHFKNLHDDVKCVAKQAFKIHGLKRSKVISEMDSSEIVGYKEVDVIMREYDRRVLNGKIK